MNNTGAFLFQKENIMRKKIIRILISLVAFASILIFGAYGFSSCVYKRAKKQLDFGLKETEESRVYATIADVNDTGVTDASENYRKTVTRLAYQDYTGDAVVTVNGNVPMFTDDEVTMTSFKEISDLDENGRTGMSIACLSKDMMPTLSRDFDLSEIKPSGFINRCYPELIEEDGWLFHRCHVLGYQLTGETTNPLNLFTGTRFLNENGMLWQENAVAQQLREVPGIHIMYRVTPVYRDDELVCRGVLMEAFSVEDNGGFQFCVYCFNVQPGIEIDYRTGESKIGG